MLLKQSQIILTNNVTEFLVVDHTVGVFVKLENNFDVNHWSYLKMMSTKNIVMHHWSMISEVRTQWYGH